MHPSECITVLKERQKPLKLNAIIFDTETKTEETSFGKELKLRFGYYKKIIDGKENNLKKDNDFFFSKKQFTDYILDASGFAGHTKYIWAHNTSFDFRIGIDTKTLKQQGYSLTCFSINPFIIEYVKDYDRILFLDTFNFFKTSIERLGAYFGIEKIQIDFENEDKIDLVLLAERCKRDVQVCFKVLESLYPQMGNRVKVSAAQLAFSSVRECLPYDIQKINTQLADLAYHGGRVEVFRHDKAYTKKFDINSQYPYVMWKYQYPISLEGTYIYPTKKFIQMQIEKGLGFIADCNFNVPENTHVPYIPYIREKIPTSARKLIFPVGKFRSVVCSPEINFDWATNVNSIEFYYMGDIFKTFVEKNYPLKQISTGFMREFYKGNLNSSYGKCAQKRLKTQKFPKYDNFMQFGATHLTDLKNDTYHMKFLDGECFCNIAGERKYSVVVAAFVCSYARRYLYDKSMSYIKDAYEDLYYYDTDCFALPESYNLGVDNELGGIKLEDEGVSQFFCPKIYYYEKDGARKIKLKGVKKTWSMDWRDGEIYTKGKRFTNFSETLAKNMCGILEIMQEKKISLKDDKRNWSNGNISKPIILSEV